MCHQPDYLRFECTIDNIDNVKATTVLDTVQSTSTHQVLSVTGQVRQFQAQITIDSMRTALPDCCQPSCTVSGNSLHDAANKRVDIRCNSHVVNVKYCSHISARPHCWTLYSKDTAASSSPQTCTCSITSPSTGCHNKPAQSAPQHVALPFF
jgi:hypothetical protein